MFRPLNTKTLETNYTFSIRAQDSANNVSGVLGYGWEQNNRPETLITNPISGTVSTTSATFYFSSNEADVTFQCQKGDEAFLIVYRRIPGKV